MSESASSREHEAQAAGAAPVRCAVLTVSDSRTLDTDRGGALAIEHLSRAGHEVVDRAIVRDDSPAIRGQLQSWIGDPRVEAIIATGGTGIAQRDGTVEVVRGLLSIELEGFGELFRVLSYEQVKAAAMLSRAVGGLVIREAREGGDTFIFALPGSPNAVETAMVKLICPQLKHLVWERRR